MSELRRSIMRLGLGSLLVAACGGAGGSAPPDAPHGHSGHGHHAHGGGSHGHDAGTLVHRFERAADWAPMFDDPARDAWQKPATVVGSMGLVPGMTVADLGAGTGYFEPWLSRAVGPSGTVLALDVEPDMVRHMKERAEREHLANVRPMLVAGDDPKLAAGSVDRILIVDTWHHIDGREAYARKLGAALKPGGQVFVVDFKLDAKMGPPPAHRLAPETVMKELSAGGLTAKVAAVDLPEQYVVVARK